MNTALLPQRQDVDITFFCYLPKCTADGHAIGGLSTALTNHCIQAYTRRRSRCILLSATLILDKLANRSYWIAFMDYSTISYYQPHRLYCIGLSRYFAITNLPIQAVFVEYLRQFLIDLNQIYRHSSVPKNTSP